MMDREPEVTVSVGAGVPGHIADYAREKITRLFGHLSRPVLSARVRVTRHADPAATRPVVAQANVDVNGRLIRAQVAAESAGAAVDLLDDRLRRRLSRVTRHRDHRRGGPGEAGRPNWNPRSVGEREVVRRKSFTLARLDCDAAAAELAELDYDFHVFTEIGSGRDSVLYRTDAGLRLAQVDPRPGEVVRGSVPVTIDADRVPALDTDEAVRRLELTGAPFVFHLDRANGRGSVVYRRYDGHYGVIAPAG